MLGGGGQAELGAEEVDGGRGGIANLARHAENIRKFGIPPVVALNRFDSDTPAEVAKWADVIRRSGAKVD